MSLHYYNENEDIKKEEESINKYIYLFKKYYDNPPTLSDALKEMFLNSKAPMESIDYLVNDIISKTEAKINENFEEIQEKYPNVSEEDSKIICSYTCECKNYSELSPYKILNKNLVSNDRKEGVENVSKYLFILLKSLRKLERYYPNEKDKYLYRCIRAHVNIDDDTNNNKIVPYKEGNIKTFWAFTSTSLDYTISLKFFDEDENKNKTGTFFTLFGKVWGYDITLFNYFNETEILLEPERKFKVEQVLSINDIIFIRCDFQDNQLVLDDLLKNKKNLEQKIEIYIDIKEDNANTQILNNKDFNYEQLKDSIIYVDDKKYKFNTNFSLDKGKHKIIIIFNNIINNYKGLFKGNKDIIEIKFINLIIKNITDMAYMFSECSNLTNLDLSNFNTENVTNMNGMFYNCTNLTNLVINNFNTKKVIDMNGMFSFCSSLTNLNLSNFNTENVTDMAYMFRECSNLTKLVINNFNTENVTNMNRMFSFCSSLTNLDLSNFNTENVTNMAYMFSKCSNLKNLDLRNFNTENVINIAYMFSECHNLTNLDLSNFNTKNAIDMAYIFNEFSLLDYLNLSKEKMFDDYSNSINLNLNYFNLKNVNKSIKFNAENIRPNKIAEYTLVKTIGKGGCGICYMAKDENNKFYAIKAINIQNKDIVNKEINILKIMKSKYSVNFIESVENDENIYIVMELCDGDLYDLLNKKFANKDIITIIKIINQLNEVLKLMHSKKIEHRDLKPENILIKYNYDYIFNYIIVGDKGKILIK